MKGLLSRRHSSHDLRLLDDDATPPRRPSLAGAGRIIVAVRVCLHPRILPPGMPNKGAPVEVPSGDVVRHRLSLAGDRQLNRALHVMAMTQILCRAKTRFVPVASAFADRVSGGPLAG